jgi:hypothetical protein
MFLIHPVILMINVTHDYFVYKGLSSLVSVLQSILFLCLDLETCTL